MNDSSGRFGVYEQTTGRIRVVCVGARENAADQCDDSCDLAEMGEGMSGRTHYIDVADAQPLPRPATPCTRSTDSVAADGADTLTLSDLALDTRITIAGPARAQYTASGTDELTFTVPGTYRFTVTAPFPALPLEFVIHAS